MKLAVACLVVLALLSIVEAKGPSASIPRPKSAKILFDEFALEHNKVYATEEERAARFEIFKDNIARIEAMNKRGSGALYGITRFSDLTPEEFRAQYLGYRKSANSETRKAPLLRVEKVGDLPTSFDWRDKGAVTPTKDQGQCGSCWAFSATEAIESQWFLAGHPLPVLSEQQIVDCDKGRGDQGCSGGDTPTAYQYVIAAGGLDSESSYPYTAEDDPCAFKSNDVVAKISGWNYVTTTKNETEMMYGLVAKGPLSICVDASSWQFYSGGVITDFCSDDLDHCVMITGFKNEAGWDGVTYPVWTVRNSWGASWGYGGYLYVERGSDLCGIADEVTLPKV